MRYGYCGVYSGTRKDSIWFGSPQWQIEAFRRIELPPDLQDKLDLAPLGPADGPVKNAIFGINAAGQYGLALDAAGPTCDRLRRRRAVAAQGCILGGGQ